ncbi:MAG TPA: DUF2339 domain-containing protein [Solirubrobacteraceae bacterium]|nr:DUF2339 domain-containing protein [Solirubrobacteraceae bacterium]
MSIDERVHGLERRTHLLEVRLAELEGRKVPEATRHEALRHPELPPGAAAPRLRPEAGPGPAAPQSRPSAPASLAAAGSAPPPSARRLELPRPPQDRGAAPTLEDLLGGRVLAWAGGLTLLAGLLFLLVIAVSRDWIGEEARTLLAAATSMALLTLGAHTYERRGHTDSALAATATGIAGLFASIVVAVQAYELIPASAGLALAFAVAATATILAIRWEAEGIAGLGILGAVASPVLVGAELGPATTAFLFLATASAVGVVLWRRWTWLAFATFVLATPQWVAWLVMEAPSAPEILVTLLAFGGLGVIAAAGFELRTRTETVDFAPHLLLALNALVLAWIGWGALSETAGHTAGHAWLAGLAVAHLAGAAVSRRMAGVSHDLSLAAAVLGVALGNIAFASVVDGLPLVAGWTVIGVAMAAFVRAARHRLDAELALGGVAVHLGLALGHMLVYDAPLSSAGAGSDLVGGVAVALVAAGCFASARIAGAALAPITRTALEGTALVLVAYLGAVVLSGPALTLTWAAEAVALAELARRHRDPLARAGAVGFLACAALHALIVLAPLDALVNGLADPLGALALLAVAGAALAAARMPEVDRVALGATAAVAVLYLASTELITVFQPVSGEAAVGGLGVRQQGQALLSGLWAVVGVATLLAGLVRDRHELRVGALSLLSLTLAKVILYDLSSLDSLYRVASFIALGALLLLGAFAWQRLRPAGAQ